MMRFFPRWNRIRRARWLILVLLALPFACMAQSGDWIYHVRPHDNIWTLAHTYLKPGVSWQKLQKYNHVTDPYHLPPGDSLRIPVAWLRVQPARAKVVAVHGQAEVHRPGQAQAVAVTAGMTLGYGARVDTGADASLTLEFADGSRLLMHADSELELDRLSAWSNTGMADTRLRLQHGRISNTVTHMPGTAAHFTVQTPSAISSVRGTWFRAIADEAAHRSRVEVLKGGVGVSGEHHSVDVPAGSGVAVAHGAPPGKVRRLLSAPAPACPAQPVTHLSHQLSWPALPGAVRYRMQIAPDTGFTTLLFDRTSGATPHASLPDLPNGSYVLRLRGIDDQGLEGLDATCTVRIYTHPQPPLVQAPQAGSKVRDERPDFRWTQSTEAASYAWQLAGDAQFTRLLASQLRLTGDHVRAPKTLPPGHYYWRIASRTAGGQLGPYSDPLPFDRIEPPSAPALAPPKRTAHGLTLSWSTGAPGQRYRIQVAHHADFADPKLDKVLDKPTLSMRKPGLGTWYIRVRTIDTDGYAGAWGPVQTVKFPCKACSVAEGIGGGLMLLWLLL